MVDGATAQQVPPEPPWTGRVQLAFEDRYVLVTANGYEWRARPDDVREATADERAAYDAAVSRRGEP
ncbi:hypothetical protein JW592_03590 [Streptomyces sp. DW4-2]|uniref:Uncharacterized protein n=1 Tax=Streptomyces spirodelae TaxID=2812904 RepID=A0ABS3WN63_9ACTN|nr:hypothetical protein [Streptomyces spirodelae]